MRSKISLYVLTFVAVVFTTACDRHASQKTSITLQMPRELQATQKVDAFSGPLTLQHLALQITGPGITETIQLIKDSNENASINPEVVVDVPAGEGRIIQLLAAYGNGNDDNPTLFYGDVVTSLRSGENRIEIPVSKVGGASVNVMTRVSGRYLTSANSGPTGELRMMYKPSGKPAMMVDKSRMFGGWFEASVFDTIPVDYVLDSGFVVGTGWTSASFSVQPHLIKVSTPDSYRRYQQNYVQTYEFREARDEIYGFFAADNSFLADKKICVSVTTQKGGSIHSLNAFATQALTSARPYRHFEWNQTFTPSTQYVTVSGGLTLANCGTFLPSEEFSKLLLYQPPFDSYTNYDNQFILGFEELIAKPMGKFDAMSGMQMRLNGGVNSYSSAFGFHAFISLLPGTESQVEAVRMYNYVGGMSSNYDDRCDRIDPSIWQLRKTIAPLFSGNKLIVKTSDLPSGSNYVRICLQSQGRGVGRLQDIYFDQMNPATSMQLTGASFITNTCHPIHLMLKNGSSDAKSTSVTPFFISASDYALHERSDCGDTALNSVNVTVEPGMSLATFYAQLPSAGNLVLTPTSGPAGITLSSATTFTFAAPAGGANKMVVVDPYKAGIHLLPGSGGPTELYASGCFPLSLAALNMSTPANATAEINLEVKDLGSGVVSSGLSFYTDCTLATPISTLSFSGEHRKSFAVKTSATPGTDLQVVASGGGFYASLPLNIINQATRISATASSSVLTYQCYPVTLTARDSTNNPKPVSAATYVDLRSTAGQPQDIMYYSDNICTVPITNAVIAASSTTPLPTTVYMMTTKQQTADITTHSLQAFLSSNFTITSTASTLTTQNLAAMQYSTAMTVTLTGGSAPYNITTTTPSYWTSVPVEATYNSGIGRYTFNVFASNVSGNANIRISDGAGQVINLTITIGP